MVSSPPSLPRPWRFWARHGAAWLGLPLLLLGAAGWVSAHGLDAPLLVRANAWLLGRASDGGVDPTLAALWSALSAIGRGMGLLTLFLLVAARRPDWTAAGLIVLVLGGWAIGGLKGALDEPRPPAALPAGQIHVLGEALRDRSMPSGHAAGAFASAAVLLLSPTVRRRSRLAVATTGALALTLASAIALSRLAAGVHWPRDVLAGAALGWLFGAWAVLLARRTGLTRWCAGATGQRAATLALVVCGWMAAAWSWGYPQGAAAQSGLAAAAWITAARRAARQIGQASQQEAVPTPLGPCDRPAVPASADARRAAR